MIYYGENKFLREQSGTVNIILGSSDQALSRRHCCLNFRRHCGRDTNKRRETRPSVTSWYWKCSGMKCRPRKPVLVKCSSLRCRRYETSEKPQFTENRSFRLSWSSRDWRIQRAGGSRQTSSKTLCTRMLPSAVHYIHRKTTWCCVERIHIVMGSVSPGWGPVEPGCSLAAGVCIETRVVLNIHAGWFCKRGHAISTLCNVHIVISNLNMY